MRGVERIEMDGKKEEDNNKEEEMRKMEEYQIVRKMSKILNSSVT